MNINEHRPYSLTGYGPDTTPEHHRPPASVLSKEMNAELAKADKMRERLNAAQREHEELHGKGAWEAAEKEDLRANADAAAAGTAMPGRVNTEALEVARKDADMRLQATQLATTEAISVVNGLRSQFNPLPQDTQKALSDIAAAIDAVKAAFDKYSPLEARDGWMQGHRYEVRSDVYNLSILPGVFDPRNSNGAETHPVAVILDQLKIALGGGQA